MKHDWEPLPKLLASLEQMKGHLARNHKDLTRLASTISLERRAAFWGWEVIAAFLAFAVASLVGFPPLRSMLDVVLGYWGWALSLS